MSKSNKYGEALSQSRNKLGLLYDVLNAKRPYFHPEGHSQTKTTCVDC